MVDSIVDNMSLRTQRKAELRLEIDLAATAAQLQALTDAINKYLLYRRLKTKWFSQRNRKECTCCGDRVFHQCRATDRSI